MGVIKYSYETVKECVEKEGYTLLSKEYRTTHDEILLKCPKGHRYKTTFNFFKGGSRCPRCRTCYSSIKHTYQHIKEYIEKEGFKLLSKEYINRTEYLEVECPEHHIYKVRFSNFKKGHRCPYCHGNARLSLEEVRKRVEVEGYTLITSKYVNSSENLELECLKGHLWNVKLSNFVFNKRRCPVCNAQIQSSKMEKELLKIVKSFTDYEVIPNDRTQIYNESTGYNLELDIWIPELRKAIEFNGKYWHSFEEVAKKDKIKRDQCESKNIDLLIINEENWKDNKIECLKEIKGFLSS